MNDLDNNSRQVALVIATAAVIALIVGFAVARIMGESEPADSTSSSPPSSAGGADVVGLLPNSEVELRQAVTVAEEFTVVFFLADGDRAQRIEGLATPEYAELLAAEAPTPLARGEEAPQGVADVEVAAEATGIRDLAADSVTYLVRADVTTSDSAEQRFEYAVNLTRQDGAWLVNGFQDATLGDAGVV